MSECLKTQNMKVVCPVQSKVKCVFESKVIQTPSKKHKGQNYIVVASKDIRSDASDMHKSSYHVSEKIDGTCCYVHSHNGNYVCQEFLRVSGMFK